MRNVTAGTLVTRAKQRADYENQSNPSDSEWKTYLSLSYGELHGLCVETGLRYFEASSDVTTDGVDNLYALPGTHLTTVGVDRLLPGSLRYALTLLTVQERNMFAGLTGDAVGYSFSGQNLAFYPTPPAGQTYQHIYIAQPTDLSAALDGDNVDTVTADGEGFLLWSMAFYAKNKNGQDVAREAAEREASRERFQFWAAQRVLTEGTRRTVSDGPDGFGSWLPGDWVH